jgi:hypothetical protein
MTHHAALGMHYAINVPRMLRRSHAPCEHNARQASDSVTDLTYTVSAIIMELKQKLSTSLLANSCTAAYLCYHQQAQPRVVTSHAARSHLSNHQQPR